MNIDWGIMDKLEKPIKRFKHKVLDNDYESFKDCDYLDWGTLFMTTVVNNTKKMIELKVYLLSKGESEERINKLFYFFLKTNHKFENKIFSWNEMEELDLDFDPDMKTTIDYTIL